MHAIRRRSVLLAAFALLALAKQAKTPSPKLLASGITILTLIGAALLYGDGIITPIVPFADAAAALAEVFRSPERGIKLGVTFAT